MNTNTNTKYKIKRTNGNIEGWEIKLYSSTILINGELCLTLTNNEQVKLVSVVEFAELNNFHGDDIVNYLKKSLSMYYGIIN